MKKTRTIVDGLSVKEQTFVNEYVKTLSVQKAAIATGCKPGPTASISGGRLVRRPTIVLAIMEAMREKSLLARIDASWVLKRLALLADFSIKNFIVVDDNGRLYYDFAAATDDDWYCINEVTVTAVRAKHRDGDKLWVNQVRIKVGDKMKALELVGKHVDVQAFKERIDVNGTISITEVTRVVIQPGGASE